jgi:integrase
VAIILFGAEHGASKQEILSLQWSDIDFDWSENGVINLFDLPPENWTNHKLKNSISP